MENNAARTNANPLPPHLGFWERAGKLISKYEAEIASGTGIIFTGSASVLFKIDALVIGGLALVIGVSSNVAGMWKASQRKQQVEVLEKQVASLQQNVERLEEEKKTYAECVKDMVYVNVVSLGREVYKLSNTDRISVYKSIGNDFVLVGRYSPNPALKNYNRHSKPHGQGAVEKAWQMGEFFRDDMPDASKGRRGERNWTNYQIQHFGIPREVARAIKMKCRLIYGKQLVAPGREPIGVLIVESEVAGRFGEQFLKTALSEAEYSRLCGLVELWREEGSERVTAFQNE